MRRRRLVDRRLDLIGPSSPPDFMSDLTQSVGEGSILVLAN